MKKLSRYFIYILVIEFQFNVWLIGYKFLAAGLSKYSSKCNGITSFTLGLSPHL